MNIKRNGTGKQKKIVNKFHVKYQILLAVLFLAVGTVFICYPFISRRLYEQKNSRLISEYDQATKVLEQGVIETAFKAAEEYNQKLLNSTLGTGEGDESWQEEYKNLLNLTGDGMMCWIEIPSIRIRIQAGHGTSAGLLAECAGHLEGTSLPVGGKGTHAALSAHTGLAGKRLFTDLTDLKEGDKFYLHVLNRVLDYRVDQIKTVTPEDTSDLVIDPEMDYVTLLTCTPYGVNDHRLLVRGIREVG